MKLQIKKGKKVRTIVALLILIVTTTLVGTLAVKANEETKAYVNVESRLNLREEPNTNCKILDKLFPGEVVTVQGNTDKEWLKVTTNDGLNGYVSSQYVEYPTLINNDYEMVATAVITAHSSSENRNYNLAKACEAIDGLVLLPGQEFDWFWRVGEASVARGYKLATVINNGQYVMGEGGGVCQVSTALYNCINNLGIVPTEHHHHSKSSSYVAQGMDATVAYPSLNFKFENTLEYTLIFEAYAEGSKVVITAYRER